MLALVVDDSRAMRIILTRITQRLGFDVCDASNGREAMELLSAAAPVPDLALIDWNMPEMNGLELITAIRADERLRGMTLLMVSTEGERRQLVRALAAGAHEYLIKPFTAESLASKLELLGLIPTGSAR